jgi:hypothetical protein
MKTLLINDTNISLFNNLNKTGDNYTLVINGSEPVGLFTTFNNDILKSGLIEWLVLNAYQAGDLSLGQLAKQFKLTLTESIDFLGSLNIPIVDYDLNEDLKTIEKWNHENNC